MSLQINVCLASNKKSIGFNNMICRYDRNLSQKRFKVRDLLQILLLKLSEFKRINYFVLGFLMISTRIEIKKFTLLGIQLINSFVIRSEKWRQDDIYLLVYSPEMK